jgi:RND family efflux transporter MFP subunit
MSKRTKVIAVVKIVGALLGLVVIVVWTSGALRSKQSPGKFDVEGGQPLPVDAVVLTIETEMVPTRVSVPGTVSSERMINLSSRLSAYVDDVHVSAGSPVKKGELLIALDQRELQKQLEAAEAQLTLAQTAFERAKRLLETNATTQQAFEGALSAYKSASAAVDQVKVMLTYTRITAPLDGVVTDRLVEPGDLASPGQVLVSVYDPSRLRLEVPVPARLISHLPVGQEVDVKLDLGDRVLKGTVTEVVSAFDPVTRTRRVKVRLNDSADDAVLPGMYGKLLLDTDPHEAVLLPAGAIKRIGQLESVGVVRNGRIVRRLIRSGQVIDGRREVLSGLAAGEQVVLSAEQD